MSGRRRINLSDPKVDLGEGGCMQWLRDITTESEANHFLISSHTPPPERLGALPVPKCLRAHVRLRLSGLVFDYIYFYT